MATRGRKTIPFNVLRDRRTNQRCRHGTEKDQVKVEVKIPKPPRVGRKSVMGPAGKKEWRRITELMQNAGVITELDRAVMTQYCFLWQTLLEDPKAFKQHSQLRICAAELGLSSSSRARLRDRVNDHFWLDFVDT